MDRTILLFNTWGAAGFSGNNFCYNKLSALPNLSTKLQELICDYNQLTITALPDYLLERGFELGEQRIPVGKPAITPKFINHKLKYDETSSDDECVLDMRKCSIK